jgi:hypothetical protein
MMLDLAPTRLAGSGDARDLLLVGPSLGTSVSALWGRCTTHLGRQFEVVDWDLPGHGHSRPATSPFAVGDIAGTVREVAGAVAGRRASWWTVGFQFADRDVRGQLLSLLGGVDHLGENEDVTLHRRAGLRPGRMTATAGAGSAARPSRPGDRTMR